MCSNAAMIEQLWPLKANMHCTEYCIVLQTFQCQNTKCSFEALGRSLLLQQVVVRIFRGKWMGEGRVHGGNSQVLPSTLKFNVDAKVNTYRGCPHLPSDICLTAFSFSHSWVLWWLNISRLWDLCCLENEKKSQGIKAQETGSHITNTRKSEASQRIPEGKFTACKDLI